MLAAAAIAGCAVFPASNPWNQRVDGLPLHAKSDAIVRSIGADETMHPDFGSGLWEGRPIGIPINVVARDAKRTSVPLRVRGRVRSRAVSDPFVAEDRGRLRSSLC